MNYLHNQYMELLKKAEKTNNRKEAIDLINRATLLQEQMEHDYRYSYSGLN